MNVRLGAASFVGIILESVHYGMFCSLFAFSMHQQWGKFRSGKRLNHWIIMALILLFLLSTTHLCINIARLYEAVITLRSEVPLDLYFANLGDKKQIALTAIFELEFVIGDAIIIHRLYHVYRPRWSLWICVFPVLCYIAMIVSLVFLAKAMADVSGGPGPFAKQMKLWVEVSFSLTLVVNVYCTGLIFLRLWKSHRNFTRVGKSYSLHVLIIVMESAALMVIYHLATFITFNRGSNIQSSFVDASSPIVGITLSLILIRLNLSTNTVLGKSRSVEANVVFASQQSAVKRINMDVTEDINMVNLETAGSRASKSDCSGGITDR